MSRRLQIRNIVASLGACLGIWGCQKTKPPRTYDRADAEAIVDHLIDMGYLKFVPDDQQPSVRVQLVDTAVQGYLDTEWNDDCVSTDLRSYPADNENLAEGDIGVTILLMKPVLEQEGVKLESVEDDFGTGEGGEGYSVTINGETRVIYDSEAVQGTDIWSLSLKRLLEIVNGLLSDAGSSERLYAVYGGNDGRVILLTQEKHDYIESMGGVLDTDWMPYSVESIEVGGRP